MEAATILVEFVITKAIIIEHEFANKQFLLNEDMTDLLSWSNQECTEILENIKKIYPKDTRHTCPWCIKYGIKCENCGYGARHKICSSSDSDFMILRKQVSNKYGSIRIVDIPGMHLLQEILKIPYAINYELFCKVHNITEK